MTTSNESAPVLMVRTIPDLFMDRHLPGTLESVKLALGERAATFISPSHRQQFSTAIRLQDALAQENALQEYRHEVGMCDVMDKTQFERNGAKPVNEILTQAALRGIWTPDSDRGLVMVTSVYPIYAALHAQKNALGAPRAYQHSITDGFESIVPGHVVEINPELIGFVLPEPETPALEVENTQPGPVVPRWLDIFRRKPHN